MVIVNTIVIVVTCLLLLNGQEMSNAHASDNNNGKNNKTNSGINQKMENDYISLSYDNRSELDYKLRRFKECEIIGLPQNRVMQVNINGNDCALVATLPGKVVLVDLEKEKVLKEYNFRGDGNCKVSQSDNNGIVISHNNKTFAYNYKCDFKEMASVIEVGTGNVIHNYSNDWRGLTADVTYLPDDNTIVIANIDHYGAAVEKIDLGTHKKTTLCKVGRAKNQAVKVDKIKFTKNGKYAIVAQRNTNRHYINEINKNDYLVLLLGTDVGCEKSCYITKYDLITGKKCEKFKLMHKGNISGMSVASNDSILATYEPDRNIINIWELDTGKKIKTLRIPSNVSIASHITFSKNDLYLISLDFYNHDLIHKFNVYTGTHMVINRKKLAEGIK